MREFNASSIDSVTGNGMVLSDVSYNMAMDWLSKELERYGFEIYLIEQDIKSGIKYIFTSGKEDPFLRGRTFYYDESRGYLLGE